MTEAPTFIRRDALGRKVAPTMTTPSALEPGIRDILAKLKATADRDVCEVLAGATNVYISAIVRLTGQGMFKAKDVDNLLTVWQILLDAGRSDGSEFAGRSSGPKSEPKAEAEGDVE